MLQGLGLKARIADLAFMAVGTLLSVKILGCHAEHVVTLYANTVKSRLSRRRSFLLWSMRLWLGWVRAHNGILAQRCATRNPGRALGMWRHPGWIVGHLNVLGAEDKANEIFSMSLRHRRIPAPLRAPTNHIFESGGVAPGCYPLALSAPKPRIDRVMVRNVQNSAD
jgi:hypothetical protein